MLDINDICYLYKMAKDKDEEVIDIRGDKYNGCKLFSEGKALDDKTDNLLVGGGEYEGDC